MLLRVFVLLFGEDCPELLFVDLFVRILFSVFVMCCAYFIGLFVLVLRVVCFVLCCCVVVLCVLTSLCFAVCVHCVVGCFGLGFPCVVVVDICLGGACVCFVLAAVADFLCWCCWCVSKCCLLFVVCMLMSVCMVRVLCFCVFV